MFIRTIVPALAVVLALMSYSRAADDDAKYSTQDQDFITEAANGGQMEVTLGKYVADNAADADVKKFAQRMVEDHRKANDELMGLTKKKGVEMPPKPDPKHQEMIDQIQKLKGEELDKAYMKMMVLDHRKDIEAFDKAARGADNADLKAWAAKTLPVLKEHLKMAGDTAKKVGVPVTDTEEGK